MQNEATLLSSLLKESKEFKRFYDGERPKVGSITWTEESVMPAEDIIAYADMPKKEIHYIKNLFLSDKAYTFAHEIMHLVRYQENGLLIIRYDLPSFFVFVAKLSSMLEDPIVDSFLQKSYNFDLKIPYRTAINYCRKTIKEEASDNLSRLLNGIDLANYMLRWSLIENEAANDDWIGYLKWYRELRPYSYKIAEEIVRIVWVYGGAHGAETIEKQKRIVERMIDLYQLQNVISLDRP